jgi:hypothetical protein
VTRQPSELIAQTGVHFHANNPTPPLVLARDRPTSKPLRDERPRSPQRRARCRSRMRGATPTDAATAARLPRGCGTLAPATGGPAPPLTKTPLRNNHNSGTVGVVDQATASGAIRPRQAGRSAGAGYPRRGESRSRAAHGERLACRQRCASGACTLAANGQVDAEVSGGVRPPPDSRRSSHVGTACGGLPDFCFHILSASLFGARSATRA